MSTTLKDIDFDDFDIDDSDSHNLFASPDARTRSKAPMGANGTPIEPVEVNRVRMQESQLSAEESREAALRQELENVRKVNEVLEGVYSSLEKAKNNMETVSRTITSASTLLQTWTRILSQTEHNQRLILNPAWQGASQDLTNIENEAQRAQQETQRRQIEEQQRREAAARKAEDDERRRAETASKGTTGVRGRGRAMGKAGSGMGDSSSRTAYVGVGGQGGRGARRAGTNSARGSSGIGRGLRGRGRGLS